MHAEPKDWPNQSREKRPSPLGTSIFVGLRAADTVLQYSILQRGWGSQVIQSLGGSVIPFATPRDPALAYFGLSPYPAIISALALGASTKHVAWILGISEQEMSSYHSSIRQEEEGQASAMTMADDEVFVSPSFSEAKVGQKSGNTVSK